jgi:8-oxo-dGTP pyrophosphatase MutT (NUDIX family)
LISDSLPFSVSDGTALLEFSGDESPQRYDLLLNTSRRLGFADPSVRRVEVNVCVEDAPRRRALHRAGFRLEGIARAAALGPDGPIDIARYALLRDEVTEGRHGFTAVMNSVTARKRVIAHLLVTGADGSVCVLETTFKPDFELPGGILEIGESPRAGLAREIQEELSTDLAIGRLLVVDWLAPYLGWEDAVELIFDGGEVTSPESLRPDLKEIRAAHWLAPDAAIARMAPFAQGRLGSALAARAERSCHYLEAGVRVS